MGPKAIILVRSIDDPHGYSFDYPFEDQLNELAGQQLISLDNHSDRMMISYLKQVTEENEKIYVVLDLRIDSKPGFILALLNSLIKRTNIELVCLGESEAVIPFLKLYHGKTFGSEGELIDYLNSKSSASF